MISLKVIDTDEFMDMPQTTQLLYYNFAMRADDDGFVANPKRIVKMTGSNDDDLKVLVAKKYIIPFDSGVCVIRHWRIHNYIQKDRYTETEYIKERDNLALIKGKYEHKDKCIQNVSKKDTQVRLGKVRIGKDNINTLFEKFYSIYPKKIAKPVSLKSFTKLEPDEALLKVILSDIDRRKKSEAWKKDGGRYIPYPATYLNQQRWEDEEDNKTDFLYDK